MPTLICYGSCNPTRQAIDSAVVEFRKTIQGEVGAVCSPPATLVDRLNTLRHTTHRPIDDVPTFPVGDPLHRFGHRHEWFACTDCGAPRPFGAR